MTFIPFIDLKSQYTELKPDIQRRIIKVLEHGQYIMGPEVKELEKKLAEYVGVKHCISASSGTDTLLIALLSLGIGPGDQVITSPFTYFATAEMIALVGATPIFVDIDPQTYNIDANKIERAISSQTKAIMPVSLFGQCSDMDTINAIAKKRNLPVIEDGAQSFGALYKGKRSCGLSTIGSTSFFPSKPLGAYGDGGALFTDDDSLAEVMREIRIHGQSHRYHHLRIGINGRLDTLQAAVLLAKLDRFDWEIEKRQELGERYGLLISDRCPSVRPPLVKNYNTSVFAQYTIQCESRDYVAQKLKDEGIPTAVHYPIPLHKQAALKDLATSKYSLKNSELASKRVLSLPMSPGLSTKHQSNIVQVLYKVLNEN